jgi:hypothetical protein
VRYSSRSTSRSFGNSFIHNSAIGDRADAAKRRRRHGAE